MPAYNLTEQQRQLLTWMVGLAAEDPTSEFWMTDQGYQMQGPHGKDFAGVTPTDLLAIEAEELLTVRRIDNVLFCKPRGLGIEAVRDGFQIVGTTPATVSNEPPGLTECLGRFRDDHPDPRRAGFLMMRYSGTRLHDEITQAVRACLKKFGISALRADDKQYHEDLYPTIATYMHGCGFGIAVFDRLETEVFNPNISLEVGYMLGLRKKVCILKDKTLTHLHTDLIGKLFRQFDPQNPLQSIPEVLGAWLRENGLLE